MSMNFWKKLNKPIMVMAPMADVTDVAFRQMFAKYGKPDVMWTEFVSADGLVLAPTQVKSQIRISKSQTNHKSQIPSPKEKILIDLKYFENERPIVAQIFSGKPEMMEQAAEIVANLGFDGIDINMGCPVRTINKQMAGAELIKDHELAKEIVLATKRGIQKAGKDIPVSVKTRLGFYRDNMEEWLTALMETEPAVITVHARTRKEMSKVPANWDRVKDAVGLRDKLEAETLIFGNGDVSSLEEAKERARETGCDGVMIGRGVFGKPMFFNDSGFPASPAGRSILDSRKKLKLLLEHTKLFSKYLGEYKNFNIMKKHFKAYINGFLGAKELREKLMKTKNLKEVEGILKKSLF
jgi:nifR3 family TIM-barrel protein